MPAKAARQKSQRRAAGAKRDSSAAKAGSSETAESSVERIWRVATCIPRGRVATYGQLAELAGLPRAARRAGYAMRALPSGSRVPWQRVVNARGEVSPRSDSGGEIVQRVLLEREGVRFDARGRIDLARYGWRPH
jgi:methylated-DNA-protein-cysteine methyltransferase-like protein